MSEKLSIARLKRFGETFEVSIDVDKALLYKKGLLTDLSEAVQAQRIFVDAHRGEVASQGQLQKAFSSVDFEVIADRIIKEGEVQLSAAHLEQEREQKLRRLVHYIHLNALDPRTGFVHPVARIEAALEQGKIHLDERRTVEEQLDEVIAKLRPILPLRLEKALLIAVIPGQYAGKLYTFVKNNSNLLKEEWNSDGSWRIKAEMPAGFKPEFIEKLNALTHGEVIVE